MKWYRYEDARYSSGVDEWDNSLGSHVEVHLHTFDVIRETKTGVWLLSFGVKRFAKLEARKRFACPTIEEALESFLARKARQSSIYKARLEDIEEAIYKAKEDFELRKREKLKRPYDYTEHVSKLPW